MADLFQGSLLPSTTTTTSTQQTAPEFYTNYLQDVANLGQNAVQQGGIAGFGPLQQQAFNMAPSTAFSGQNAATQAQALTGAAGTTSAPSIINEYMNPYVGNVVNEMARLQQQNLQRNVLPTIAGGGVGTGSFGSRRQQQALGQSLADMQANLTGQQYGALNTGFQNAMQSAQTDLNRQMQAGQGMGNIAQQQYQIGSGGLNTLSSLGALQQAQGQRQLDYPMVQAQNFANLLQGLNIPTGQVQQTVAPGQQGQYTNSPLSEIAGIGSLLAAISGAGTTTGTNNTNLINDLINSIRGTTPPAGQKDGGSIRSYADGGTVEPIDMQGMTKPYDLSQDESQPKPVEFDSSMFENNPVDPIMYTGGTPNFDETTGTYIDPGVKPFQERLQYLPPMTDDTTPVAMPTDLPMRNTDTPLPYERTNATLPLKTTDFTNMNLAPRDLIKNLDKAANRQMRIDNRNIRNQARINNRIPNMQMRIDKNQARINDLQARKQSLSGLNSMNRAPRIQTRIDNKQARINELLARLNSMNRGRT